MSKKLKLDTTQLRLEEVVIPVAGTIAAVIYQRIKFFCDLNKEKQRAKYLDEDRWWMWSSYAAFKEEYVYWSSMQIRRAISGLVEAGLVLVKRKAKQFKNSSKYSAVNIEDWIMSDAFQNCKKSVRVKVMDVCKHRNLYIGCVENNTPYVKNNTPCVENNIANTDIVTDIRHKLSEGKFFHETSYEKLLEIEYNQKVITADQCESMVTYFGKLFQNTNHKHRDVDHTIRLLYMCDLYSNQYPFWVRLIYGLDNGLIGPNEIDIISPKVNQELDKNPFIITILKKRLPDDFDWIALGCAPDMYIAKWDQLCNTVFKEVV